MTERSRLRNGLGGDPLKCRKSQVQDKSGVKEVGEAAILSIGRRESAMIDCLRMWKCGANG